MFATYEIELFRFHKWQNIQKMCELNVTKCVGVFLILYNYVPHYLNGNITNIYIQT